jgi:hypothetical protein
MLTPILLSVGCIVPAETGFQSPGAHGSAPYAGSPERRLTWDDAQRAAAQDAPGIEDRTLAWDPELALETDPGSQSSEEGPAPSSVVEADGVVPIEEPQNAESTTDPVVLREAAAALEEQPPPSDLVGLTDLFGSSSGTPSAIEDLLMNSEGGGVLTVRLRSGTDEEAIELPFDAFRYDVETRKLLPRADLAELGERLDADADAEAPEPTQANESSPFVPLFAEEERTTFAGQVLTIELSVPEGLAEDYVFLKVRDENNHLQRVLLGPVWFVMPTTPLSTGRPVEALGVATRDSRGALLVAAEAQLDEKPLPLRDEDGTPLWLDPDPETPQVTSVPMHGLLARDVYVDGTVWAKVTDVVIEGRSGAVRFMCCARSDAEELGDRWVVIPWSRVALVDGELVLDVEANTLKAAPSIPAGVTSDLAEADVREGIRRYFEPQEE